VNSEAKNAAFKEEWKQASEELKIALLLIN